MALVLRKGDLLIGDVLLTARAAKLSPHYLMIATDPSRMLVDRMDAAKAAEALSVVLDQPHRRGDASRDAGDALKAFCARLRLRQECQRAGRDYAFVVRREISARRLPIEGQDPPAPDMPVLTEAEETAKRELAIMDLEASNAVLRAIHPRTPRRMVLLCFNDFPPAPDDEGILVHGLLNLARHYGLLDEGINRDKPI